MEFVEDAIDDAKRALKNAKKTQDAS
jgi:hypothetical protein